MVPSPFFIFIKSISPSLYLPLNQFLYVSFYSGRANVVTPLWYSSHLLVPFCKGCNNYNLCKIIATAKRLKFASSYRAIIRESHAILTSANLMNLMTTWWCGTILNLWPPPPHVAAPSEGGRKRANRSVIGMIQHIKITVIRLISWMDKGRKERLGAEEYWYRVSQK